MKFNLSLIRFVPAQSTVTNLTCVKICAGMGTNMKKLDKHKIIELIRPFFLIAVGTLLMATAYISVFDSVGMVTGGFTGIAIIVKHQTTFLIPGGVPLWITTIVLNIPIFFVAYRVKGKHFVGRTLFATIFLTTYLAILPKFSLTQSDLLLAAVFGGVFNGAGIAMVLLSYSTTGGTDLIASIIQHYVKHESIARIMQLLDGAIVILGAFIFGIQKSLYAVIAIYVTTLVSDRVIDGLKFAKGIYIISEKYNEISQCIIDEIGRGVTILKGTGKFSNKERPVIFCVVSKKQSIEIKRIAQKYDPNAFIIVNDVREVMGEGFVKNTQNN